ncbi:hypothetical protein V8C37DRAFT_394807 [Trichoderma ceciliae]
MDLSAILPLARSLVAGCECGCVHSSGQQECQPASLRILPRCFFYLVFLFGRIGSPDRGTFGAALITSCAAPVTAQAYLVCVWAFVIPTLV